jgi:heat shock protein HslJ
VELDGDASDALLRLRFPAEGEVTGTDACGTFTARQTAPYPWFELRELDDAPAGCGAGLRRTLGTMGFAEVSGDLLLLSADDGREMLLRAD